MFGIIGKDRRYEILAELLEEKGYSTTHINQYNLKALPKNIIAPIPFAKGDMVVEGISVQMLLRAMKSSGCNILFCGVIGDKYRYEFNQAGIKVVDFFALEEIAILNAVPTAEGAIQYAMEQSESTVFNSECLVLGYGRCGKILCNMLKGIGARVSATYRKGKDRAYITAFGISPINFNSVADNIDKFRYIFNTVPCLVLGEDILKLINKDTVIIDVASAPGGVDFAFAEQLGLKAVYCPGLPGRVAPYTGANVLLSAVLDEIK